MVYNKYMEKKSIIKKNPAHHTLKRIKPEFVYHVHIPKKFQRYLWEHTRTTPCEKIILRVLTYGNFDEVKEIYHFFPEETYKIISKYPGIKRGVKYWIRYWHNGNH
ncbi:MAG TPA: hypothetical protein PKW86_03525 [bacterium]|nr:hypothetical protein [bacterium]HOL34928.1 hypothetical protein [bacterium]